MQPASGDAANGQTASLPAHDVTDLGLADEGVRRIEWAEREMPVLRLIRERFEREQPLAGVRIAAALHVTTETANLVRTLKAGGAQVALSASNPLSTKDDVAAALVARYGISTFARRGEDRDTYYAHLNAVADIDPHMTMDDGCDLVSLFHKERRHQLPGHLGRHRGDDHGRHPPAGDVRGRRPDLPGRRRQRGQDQAPVRQPLRHRPVDRGRHPAGHQHPARRPPLPSSPATAGSVGASRCASRAWAPGWPSWRSIRCPPSRRSWTASRSCPPRRRPAGASCSSPRRATSTSSGASTSWRCRTAPIMANSGHFDAELELKALAELAEGHVREVRENVQEYDLGGKRLFVIAEGRLVNLGAAEGHPAAVMDMSFAAQALAAEYVAKEHALPGARRLRGARAPRPRGRAPQARGAGHPHRRHDRGAAALRGSWQEGT